MDAQSHVILTSRAISFVQSSTSVTFYLLLFAMGLWLYVSLYCYFIEIITWFFFERRDNDGGAFPGNLIHFMIPNPDLRLSFKIGVLKISIWFWVLIDKIKGVPEEKRRRFGRELQELLPAMEFQADETDSGPVECVICLDDFVDGVSCRIFPKCNHVYHRNCIDQWLEYRFDCPTCRNTIINID